MIKSRKYNITLAWCEIAALEDYIISLGKSMTLLFDNCHLMASPHGVTVSCPNEDKANEIWDNVLEATDEC